MKPFPSVLYTHPRLIISVVLGIVVYVISPLSLRVLTRGLFAWNVTVWSFICLMSWHMLRANHDSVRKISERRAPSAERQRRAVCALENGWRKGRAGDR